MPEPGIVTYLFKNYLFPECRACGTYGDDAMLKKYPEVRLNTCFFSLSFLIPNPIFPYAFNLY